MIHLLYFLLSTIILQIVLSTIVSSLLCFNFKLNDSPNKIILVHDHKNLVSFRVQANSNFMTVGTTSNCWPSFPSSILALEFFVLVCIHIISLMNKTLSSLQKKDIQHSLMCKKNFAI